MPSSLIFAGLVVLWLLILVPIIARHRQEVPRPSDAALAGRVLKRPAVHPKSKRWGRVEEMVEMELDVDDSDVPDDALESDPKTVAADTGSADTGSADTGSADTEPEDNTALAGQTEHVENAERADEDTEPAAHAPAAEGVGERLGAQRNRDHPPPRYRRGRGGFDAEAAALAASARYSFRQRVALILLLAAVATGIVAGVGLPMLWWPHGLLDLVLVGYLVYLRRQVRLEEDIRFRRAARMAGRRFADVAEPEQQPAPRAEGSGAPDGPSLPDGSDQSVGSAGPVGPVRQAGPMEAAEPMVSARSWEPVDEAAAPALPPLPRAELPPRPRGTIVVAHDDGDPTLHDLDDDVPSRYRRAAG